jgi:predicted  nucleic acid-binding Zn-ribbon protein
MNLLRITAVLLLGIYMACNPSSSHATQTQADTRASQREPQTDKDKPVLFPASDPDLSQKELKQAIDDLTEQVKTLTAEVKKLRRANERDSAALELLLSEERLSRLEERLTEAQERKAQLESREQELQYRMRNIQQELLLRGGLRREDSEAAIRNDLQRAMEDVRKQQSVLQNRISDLQSQYDRLRRRVDELVKKQPAAEEKPNQPN